MENKNTEEVTNCPEFTNQSLQKTVAKATEAFEAYSEALGGLGDEIDSVSEDIRRLEAYFQERNIAVPYSYEYSDNENGNSETIEWGADNKWRKFRLNRVVYQNGEVKSQKALIEEPLLIRIEASAKLPKFVKGFAKKIKKISKNLKEFGMPMDNGDEVSDNSGNDIPAEEVLAAEG